MAITKTHPIKRALKAAIDYTKAKVGITAGNIVIADFAKVNHSD